MRRSKKTKTITNFKIRRCVVRLQRMKPQPMKMTRSTSSHKAKVIPTPTMKRRTINGPITSTPASIIKAKERIKTTTPMMQQRQAKIIQSRKPIKPAGDVEELPPTIAAGRSRRAYKPNPKYASEDMVTPKNIKGGGKQRKTSTSSMDDFFNKDTTDEDFDDFDDDNDDDDKKPRVNNKKIANDLDFLDTADDSDMSIQQKKKPGRPRKHRKVELPTPTTSTRRSTISNQSTPNVFNRSAPNARTTSNMRNPQSQLQQLRRTLEANNVNPLAMGRKRKLEENSIRNSIPVAAKRFLINPSANKSGLNTSGIAPRRRSPIQPLSGSKSVAKPIATNSQKREGLMNSIQERKPIQTKPITAIINSKSSSSATKSQQEKRTPSTIAATISATTTIAKANSAKTTPQNSKQNNSTNQTTRTTTTAATTTKPKSAENTKEQNAKKVTKEIKDSVGDDFETMPTFTIVNINDIINKKGDVLISKKILNKRPSTTATTLKPIKVLSNKISPDGLKNSHQQFSTSTPLTKKPTEKNVINKLMSKTLSTTTTSSSSSSGGNKKPAPLILNSVVGRKTKPVKPMITNLDITSDNPSSSINLFDDDDDDEDEDDDDDNDMDDDSKIGGSSSSNETDLLLETNKGRQSKKYATKNKSKKGSEPKTVAKENSLTATNLQASSKQHQQQETRKLSPEKVIVTRQGDKIIKKITCFETWYVINIPTDAPEEFERNTLNIPLITLANAAENINLPSAMWTTKVTLYELSTSTLSKSNVITYTGDLKEQNIREEDRYKYQPSCVMFRRSVVDRIKSQLPYDRAVIFKNKTFFTNIEGKNVKLVGAPSVVNHVNEIETLLHIVDSLTLQSSLVEPAATV